MNFLKIPSFPFPLPPDPHLRRYSDSARTPPTRSMLLLQSRKRLSLGVREEGGYPFLFRKLSRRRNLHSGFALRRPCFWSISARREASICPVRISWQLIRRSVAPGKCIFSAINHRNFNRVLKKGMGRMGIPEDSRYVDHCFRLGTAQELNGPGPPRSAVASSGIWHPRLSRLSGHVEGCRVMAPNRCSMSTSTLLPMPLRYARCIFRENPLACHPRQL